MRRIAALSLTELILVLLASNATRLLVVVGGPSSWSWEGLSRWYADALPEAVIGATGIVIVFVPVAWLTLATALQLVAELLPTVPRLRAVADVLAPVAIRRLGRTMADATVTASLLLGPAPGLIGVGGSPVSPTETATLAPIDLQPAEPAVSSPVGEPAPATPVVAPVSSVVVEPGDSFWSIAERAVTGAIGHRPTEHEVATYWRELMTVNRDRLVVEGAFDLIYPGQVLDLPDGAPMGPARLPETL